MTLSIGQTPNPYDIDAAAPYYAEQARNDADLAHQIGANTTKLYAMVQAPYLEQQLNDLADAMDQLKTDYDANKELFGSTGDTAIRNEMLDQQDTMLDLVSQYNDLHQDLADLMGIAI